MNCLLDGLKYTVIIIVNHIQQIETHYVSYYGWGLTPISNIRINHSAGKHDRGPLFFTLFSFRLIRSRSTGSI